MTKPSSEKTKKSIAYYRKLRKSNPALFKALARQAKLAIEAIKKEKTPAEAAKLLKLLLSKDKEMDPRIAPDTYGVRLFIDAMLTTPEERSKTKRYYLSVLDSMVTAANSPSGKEKKRKRLAEEAGNNRKLLETLIREVVSSLII